MNTVGSWVLQTSNASSDKGKALGRILRRLQCPLFDSSKLDLAGTVFLRWSSGFKAVCQALGLPYCPGSIQDTFIFSSISHQHISQRYFAKTIISIINNLEIWKSKNPGSLTGAQFNGCALRIACTKHNSPSAYLVAHRTGVFSSIISSAICSGQS